MEVVYGAAQDILLMEMKAFGSEKWKSNDEI